MVDPRLHEQLTNLLTEQGWDKLSAPQEAAWQPITDGRHVLLGAPTGHGKTEAALLPVLSRILDERDALAARQQEWPAGFKALYITPLRALNRDLMQRLESWAKALGITVGVRHGDTSQAERARQSRKPPDLLITTPETVQLLLYGDTLRRHLATVRFVILDEVHELASSERGSQLAIALERIEEVIAQPQSLWIKAKERPGPIQLGGGNRVQRIGLSATVADFEPVAQFMAGSRPVVIVEVAAPKTRRLEVISPQLVEDDERLAAELAATRDAIAQLKLIHEIIGQHERVLVFCNTRDGAEMLASRSAMLHEGMLGLHHGSLSADHRSEVEDDFKAGRLRALVATSSLELGIDVGAIDHVIQVGSPRSVARMVQRLGRAGHRIGATSQGTMIATGPEDHLECLAIARRVESGGLEPLRIRACSLGALANQLVALSNEYSTLDKGWVLALLHRTGPYADMDDAMFEAAWDTLLDVKTLYSEGNKISRSGRGRRHFLDNISLIPDEKKYRVIDEATKRTVGTVDDGFIAAGLHPGANFIMAGRGWRVLEIVNDRQTVRVAPAKEVAGTPQWSGSLLPVSGEVARDAAALRGEVRDGLYVPGMSEAVTSQSTAGLAVPTDTQITLEQGRHRLVANIALGTRGNDALARITTALLQQRIGGITVTSDAYRIDWHGTLSAQQVEETWRSLDPETLDLLLSRVLQDEPIVKHHLVQVSKQFGALPKDLDPTRLTKKKMQELWERFALQEETLERLVHERFDLGAVAQFLRHLDDYKFIAQGLGPISQLADESNRRMVAVPRDDAKLLQQVRKRIEASDVKLACTQCGNARECTVIDVEPKPRCRRCSSNQIACLRPWDERAALLARKQESLSLEERGECKKMHRNAALVSALPLAACRALVARGVGPSTANRILQKSADIEDRVFWREILQAELDFARTNAFWK